MLQYSKTFTSFALVIVTEASSSITKVVEPQKIQPHLPPSMFQIQASGRGSEYSSCFKI